MVLTKGSMVVMKGVRGNNLYYLKDSTVTDQVETFISSDDVCTKFWQMRLGHRVTLAKKGSLEDASTCNLKLGEHGVLDKKKVKFSTTTQGLLDCVHVSIWGPAKTASVGGHRYFIFLLIIYLGIVGYIPWDKDLKPYVCWWSGRIWWRNKLVGRLRSFKLVLLKDTRTNSYNLARTLVLLLTL